MSTTRIYKVIKDSDASAERSYAIAVQTKEIGIGTTDKLKSQGQQLKRTEEHTDTILSKQKEADRHLSAIESIPGAVTNKLHFRSNKIKHGKDENIKTKNKKTKKYLGKTSPVTVKVKSPSEMFEPINHDLLEADEKKTLEHTNITVEKISDIIDDLKQISIEQGEELDTHNARLPRLQKKITKAQVTMDVQTSRARRGY